MNVEDLLPILWVVFQVKFSAVLQLSVFYLKVYLIRNIKSAWNKLIPDCGIS